MINIFISSTFKEFQQERDWIRIYVQPQLNQYAKEQFGESVHLIDLRWGIDTSSLPLKVRPKYVLSACYDTIINGQIFLGLLGASCGTMIDKNILAEVVKEKNCAMHFHASAYSIIRFEFEISMQHSSMKRLFCVQDTNHREDDTKSLVDLIQQSYHKETHIYSYSEREKFYTDTLLKLLKNCISDICRKPKQYLTWYEEQKSSQRQRIKNLSVQDSIADTRSSDIYNRTRTCPLLIIQAKDGAGKSTLMGALDRHLKKEGYRSIFILIGNGTRCTSTNDFLRLLICELLQMEPDNLARFDKEELLDILNHTYLSKQNEVDYLLIDGLEKIASDFSNLFEWLPMSVPEKLHIVMSLKDNIKLPLRLPYYPNSLLHQLSMLDKREQQIMVQSFLNMEGKALSPFLLDALLSKKEARFPLYLKMIIFRLTILDKRDFAAISNFEDTFSNAQIAYFYNILDEMPSDFDEMGCSILRTACSSFQNSELLWEILCLLAQTRHGLRESDIDGVCSGIPEWKPLDFSVLLQYMSPFFVKDDIGRITFAYPRMGDRLCEQPSLLFRLYKWLTILPPSDSVKQSEYPELCLKFGDGKILATYLNSFDVETNLYFIETLRELMDDISQISKIYSIVTAVGYEEDFCNWLCILAKAASEISCDTSEKLEAVDRLLVRLAEKADEPSYVQGFTSYEGYCYCETMGNLAKFYMKNRRYKDAAECYDKMCDIYTSLLTSTTEEAFSYFQVQLIQSITNLSNALHMSGQKKKCEEINKLLLKILMSIKKDSYLYEKKNIWILKILGEQGIQLIMETEYKKGIELLETAQSLANNMYSRKKDPEICELLISINVNLSGAYHGYGKFAESLDLAKDTERLINQKCNASKMAITLMILKENMAKSNIALKRYEQAIEILQQSIEFWNRTSMESEDGSSYWRLAKVYLTLSDVLKKAENFQEAEYFEREAFHIVSDVANRIPSKQNIAFFIQLLDTNLSNSLSHEGKSMLITDSLRLVDTLFDMESDNYDFINKLLYNCFMVAYKTYGEDRAVGIQLLEQIESYLELFSKDSENGKLLLHYGTTLETLAQKKKNYINAERLFKAAECYHTAYLYYTQNERKEQHIQTAALTFWISVLAQIIHFSKNYSLSAEQTQWLKTQCQEVLTPIVVQEAALKQSEWIQNFIDCLETLEQWSRENNCINTAELTMLLKKFH